MQQYYYILALLFSLSGLFYLDYTHKVAVFYRPKFFITLIVGLIGFFLVWDIMGSIVLDIFHTNQEWVTGIYFIDPDLPLEEFMFLTLLSEVTILSWRAPECIRTRS